MMEANKLREAAERASAMNDDSGENYRLELRLTGIEVIANYPLLGLRVSLTVPYVNTKWRGGNPLIAGLEKVRNALRYRISEANKG